MAVYHKTAYQRHGKSSWWIHRSSNNPHRRKQVTRLQPRQFYVCRDEREDREKRKCVSSVGGAGRTGIRRWGRQAADPQCLIYRPSPNAAGACRQVEGEVEWYRVKMPRAGSAEMRKRRYDRATKAIPHLHKTRI